MNADDHLCPVQVNSSTTYVVVAEKDYEKILDALNYLKGWSMHTENGRYAENARELIRGRLKFNAQNLEWETA